MYYSNQFPSLLPKKIGFYTGERRSKLEMPEDDLGNNQRRVESPQIIDLQTSFRTKSIMDLLFLSHFKKAGSVGSEFL